MTDYTKTTDFAAKDSLPSGDSGKIIRGAEFGTEFDNIQTAVNSKSNTDNPTFTGTITGNGSGLTNVAAASIDLTVSSDTDADYNVPFMNATGDGGSAKVLQVDDNGLMFNPNSNTLSVNRLKGSNDNLLIQDTSGNTILDIDTSALEIPVNTTITGTTAVTGNITVTGTVDGRDIAADGTKLDTVETNADVTDTANVTAAGALMDSELTDIASVKALNQGVATTDSPTFAGVTANGTVEFDGLSGTGAVTVTDILDQDDMSGNSATALATQQSIKAYVDSQVGTVDTLAEVLANGNATGGTDIAFGDNDKAVFGTGSDLQIYHDGSNSFIDDTGTGSLVLQSNGAFTVIQNSSGVANARFDSAGAASIRYNGVEKLATTTTGIDVTGTATMDGLTVDGSATIGGTYDWTFDDSTLGAGASLSTNTTVHFGTTGNNSLNVYTNDVSRLKVANNGDIGFYDSAGSNQSLFWDASSAKLRTNQTSEINIGDTSGDGVQLSGNDIRVKRTCTTATQGLLHLNNIGVAGNVLEVSLDGVQKGAIGVASDAALIFSAGTGSVETMRVSSTGIDVTGTAAATRLEATTATFEAAAVNINLLETNTTDVNTRFRLNGGDFIVQTLNDAQDAVKSRLAIDNATGDVQFYEDTGTTPKFHWDAADEALGIGTTNPRQDLEIFNGDTGSGIRLAATATAYWDIERDPTSGHLTFTDDGAGTVLTVGQNGLVGIGTDDPALFSKLHVSSTTTALDAGGTIFASVTDAVAADIGGQVMMGGYYTGTTTAAFGGLAAKKENATAGNFGGYLQFLTSTNGSGNTEKMRITSDGSVGIGTNSPDAKIEIVGSGTTVKVSNATVSSTNTAIQLGGYASSDSSAYGAHIRTYHNFGVSGASSLAFETSGSQEAMRIDSSRNLLVNRTLAFTTAKVEIQSDSGDASTLALNSIDTDGDILEFHKSGNSVGSIGTEGGALYISSPYGNDSGLRFVSGIVGPATTTGANRDGAIDLGYDNGRFKDLYLSGGAYLGGTGSANKLDDYEEGTWTPTLLRDSTEVTATYGTRTGRYIKVGSLVHVYCVITTTAITSQGSGYNYVGGLPFNYNGDPYATIGVVSSNMFSGTAISKAFPGQNQNTVLFGTDESSSFPPKQLAWSSGALRFSFSYYTAS